MNVAILQRRFYSEPHHDGTRRFYDWLRADLRSDMAVLNLGAGPATRSAVRTLRGEVRSLVGADIDPAVLDNAELDAAALIVDGRLPFPDASFDCAYADYVLEHVEGPEQLFSELRRVLKPGGSFFFRTPNAWHYAGIGARVTPHWFHERFANRLRDAPADQHAPWPTFYRANDRRSLRRLARHAGFGTVELRMVECEPSYLRFSALPFAFGVAYERAVNASERLAGLRANIFGRLS